MLLLVPERRTQTTASMVYTHTALLFPPQMYIHVNSSSGAVASNLREQQKQQQTQTRKGRRLDMSFCCCGSLCVPACPWWVPLAPAHSIIGGSDFDALVVVVVAVLVVFTSINVATAIYPGPPLSYHNLQRDVNEPSVGTSLNNYATHFVI